MVPRGGCDEGRRRRAGGTRRAILSPPLGFWPHNSVIFTLGEVKSNLLARALALFDSTHPRRARPLPQLREIGTPKIPGPC